MVRTDKKDVSNKLVFLSLVVTVVLCACVAVAVFCLDLKRKEEILHLRNEVISFGEEVDYLRQQLDKQEHVINHTASTVHKIKEESQKPTQPKPVAPSEEDYYYEEHYDYEEDDDEDEADDTEDATASVPFIGDNIAPSQDKVPFDANDTLTVRSKRHVSQQEDDINVLRLQKEILQQNTYHSWHKPNTDLNRSAIQYNTELGQLVELIPSYEEQHLRHSRSRKKEKRESEIESMSPEYNTDGIAAHYGGDTRKYHIGRHKHYDGNDRLYHPSGVFKDWAPSNWISTLGMSSYFSLRDGVLTVQHSGLYLVYAQIFYADFHDTSGYRLYQNDDPVAQCTTMAHSSSHVMKRNTCFTSTILLVRSLDTIKLKEIEGNRYTIFEPTKSFFGLVKLKNV